MKTLANWNGAEMPLDEVRVPALDRAFLFGDAVYEVLRVCGGRLWRVDDHMQRLARGLQELSINFSVDLVKERVQTTLASSGESEAIIYIQISRGAGTRRFHHFPEDAVPNCLIYVEHFEDPAAPLRVEGAKAITARDVRWQRNDLKVTSLLANCMAASEAQRLGCLEAVMLRDGILTEGSRTSVFGVKNGKVLVAPSGPAVLPGITKRHVVELCTQKNIPMIEQRISEAELFELDELFLTGTTIQVVPIISLDEKPVGTGQVGPVVKQVQAAFNQSVEDWLLKAAV